jgi:K+-transporting ATPase ATPase C chain
MLQTIKPAFIMLLILTVITGIIYPLAVTGFAQLIFPSQANGSLLSNANGKTTGSKLIGQSFSEPKYFWGRPSATAPFPYNAAASSGSNLSVSNPALISAVQERINALHQADPDNKTKIPVDLITASASGLDPEISVAAANYQAVRVAKARHLNVQVVQALIAEHTQQRTWHLLGEPRMNVLELNLALSQLVNNK